MSSNQMSITQRLRKRCGVMRIEVLRRTARALINLSTIRARGYLRKTGPLRILLDNSVLGHAVTHETAWISTGTAKFGPHEIETGYAARIPVNSPVNDSRLYKEIQFLPGIVQLAKRGLIELCTSAELRAEMFRQPIGRFRGYGYFDHSLFAEIKMKSVDGLQLDLKDSMEKQIERLRRCQDEPFRSIVGLLGEQNSLDAWHIHTSELQGMFCFLCIDFPLRDAVRRVSAKKPFATLKTKVLTPSEFGKLLGLLPVHTNILSYEDSSFPVHPDLSWPNERRNRPSRS